MKYLIGFASVEECLRQDPVGGREAGDATVFFARSVDLGRVGGGGEGLEECGHRGQHLSPVPRWTSQARRRSAMAGSANSAR